VTRADLGDFPGALQMIREMKDGHPVWPLWNITELMAQAGRTSDAVALARAQELPRARAYGLLGAATSMLEQIEAARQGR
jgi:hypothetical protein